MPRRDKLTKTIAAIEALPAGVHKFAPRLYLKRENRPGGVAARTVLFRWSQDGRAQVKSLGPWSTDNYGHFLAEGIRAHEALQQGRDVRIALDEGVAPDTFKAMAELYMEQNLAA